MNFSQLDRASTRPGLHSRIALALAKANVDSETHPHVVPLGSVALANLPDYVQQIVDSASNEWQALIDHPFPSYLANGTAALNGFRHYMIQDATYLEYYYRVRMEAVGKSGTFEDIKDFAAKLSSSLEYVVSARDDCTNKMGVPENVVSSEKKSDELKNSVALYNSVISASGSSWLDIHIVLLPCIMGYDTIANKLLRKSDTLRNTLYYSLWIEANSNGSSAKKYKQFINTSIASLDDEDRKARWDGWIKNFKAACGTEKAFLELGTNPAKFSAYDIVQNGVYTIRSYYDGNQYLIPTTSSSVTVKTVDSDAKWTFTNTEYGYKIRSVSKQGNLCISRDGTQNLHISSTEEQYWSINTVTVYDATKGQQTAYQLLISGKLGFVLDSGSLNTNQPTAIIANNAQISSQIWFIEAAEN